MAMMREKLSIEQMADSLVESEKTARYVAVLVEFAELGGKERSTDFSKHHAAKVRGTTK